MWARAFASAEVVDGPDALTPSVLAAMGRDLVRRGETVWRLVVDHRGLSLMPAALKSVMGGPDPETWRYMLTLNGRTPPPPPPYPATPLSMRCTPSTRRSRGAGARR